jgi:hypothetical protein
VLGEVQYLRAIGEKGGTPFAEIKPPGIQLGERSDQINGR